MAWQEESVRRETRAASDDTGSLQSPANMLINTPTARLMIGQGGLKLRIDEQAIKQLVLA